MDKYFTADVNRAMCKEYSDLCVGDRTDAKEARKEEIRQHLAFEVLSSYTHDHGPEGNE